MRDGVDAAGDAQADRQRERELGVVDDGARQHLGVLAGLLQAGLGDAVDRRHLAAGVGGRDRQDGQARFQRDGLAQAGGGAAAHGHGAIGIELARHLARLARGLDGHVHDGAVEHAGRARAEHVGDALGRGALLGRGQHQRATRTQRLDLLAQLRQRAGPEHHAAGLAVVDEGLHGWPVRPAARSTALMMAA
jgi:hypothetical protein